MKKDNWIFIIFLMTFTLSILFSAVSNIIAVNCNPFIIAIILIVVIILGIIFDMIGTSAITANESTFHSMSSKRIKGAKETISLIKNSNKISSICNDVVGDVCGIISGGLGATLASSIKLPISDYVISIIIAAFISAFTVGGKAICKKISLKNADSIIFKVGKIKNFFHIK